MDGSIFPNTIDYWGPAGMVYVRTPQIRWTPMTGPNTFAIAIETPNNDIDPGQVREIDPGLAGNLQDDSTVPDLYDHYWQDNFSTAFGYSQTHVDNQSGQTSSAFQTGEYASVNLLWRPVKNVMMGAELLWGQRKDYNGQSGDDSRVQFTVQYKFSSISSK